MNSEELKKIKEQYPIGTKIRLDKDMDDSYPVKAGTIGEIDYIDDAGQIHMNWETGSSLALIIGVDTFTVLERPEKIKVIMIEPNKEPYIKEIYNTLEAKQELVGGYIECVSSMFSDTTNYDFIVNEEGKLTGLPCNRFIYDKKDIVFGNMIVAKVDIESGDFITIEDSEIDFLMNKIEKECPICTNYDIYKMFNNDIEEEIEMQ